MMEIPWYVVIIALAIVGAVAVGVAGGNARKNERERSLKLIEEQLEKETKAISKLRGFSKGTAPTSFDSYDITDEDSWALNVATNGLAGDERKAAILKTAGERLDVHIGHQSQLMQLKADIQAGRSPS